LSPKNLNIEPYQLQPNKTSTPITSKVQIMIPKAAAPTSLPSSRRPGPRRSHNNRHPGFPRLARATIQPTTAPYSRHVTVNSNCTVMGESICPTELKPPKLKQKTEDGRLENLLTEQISRHGTNKIGDLKRLKCEKIGGPRCLVSSQPRKIPRMQYWNPCLRYPTNKHSGARNSLGVEK